MISQGVPGQITSALGNGALHVTVPLRRVREGRILWRNKSSSDDRGQQSIRAEDELGDDQELLLRCAYLIKNEQDSAQEARDSAVGIADRYGGAGIGHNGGSGRNALINGLMVKGIGRTPLVSALSPLSHASGGAYLEECVREAVYAGVVAHDFPYGAVPTLAIIDTGLTQDWPAGISPSTERRTLLVRPPFIRPAHFERAFGFRAKESFEGERDHRRVQGMFAAAVDEMGQDGFLELVDRFWDRWAHQLAYGFVHRLSHGNNTSSNIALNGQLVDFGAASAVPSWCNVASPKYFDPFATRDQCVLLTMKSVYYYLSRHVDDAYADLRRFETRAGRLRQAFRQFVIFEVLRLCGVHDDVATRVVSSSSVETAWRACLATISWSQSTKTTLFVPGEYASTSWQLPSVWSPKPPAHLEQLRRLLLSLVPPSDRDRARTVCLRMAASRPALYWPNLRAKFFAEVKACRVPELGADAAFVQRFVDSLVQTNCRESERRTGSVGVSAAMAAVRAA